MTTIGRSLLRWLPRPVAVALALAAVGLGVAVLARPFRSLWLLALLVGGGIVAAGAAAVLRADPEDRPLRSVVVACTTVGVVAVAVPWPTARRLVVVVAVSLVVAGCLRLVGALRSSGPTAGRLSEGLRGATSVAAALPAWVWPDLTVLAVALVGGVVLVAGGVRLLWLAWRGVRAGSEVAPPASGTRRLVVASAGLVAGVVLSGLSVVVAWPPDEPDDFYEWSGEVPRTPGTLLRAQPFDASIPDGASAWRILYTTIGARGAPAVASGLVVAPTSGSASVPPPVVAWAHGTTGIARRCAPSAMADPWSPGAFFLVDDVVEQGWALVAADYIGLGAGGEAHPYLVGEPTARSVLDSVRAARQLDGLELDDRTVVWGHSQGGGAALWVGQIGSDHAPDVPLSGVAALAPASDLTRLMDDLEDVRVGSIFAGYAIEGFDAAYDDVHTADVVRPVGRVTVDEAGDRCLDTSALVSVLSSLVVGMDVFVDEPTAGAVGARMAENVPRGPFGAPLLIAQGAADSLVTASMQRDYVAGLCAAGRAVDYREYEGRDHVPLVEADSPLVPDLIEWTRDRFAGATATDGCDPDGDR